MFVKICRIYLNIDSRSEFVLFYLLFLPVCVLYSTVQQQLNKEVRKKNQTIGFVIFLNMNILYEYTVGTLIITIGSCKIVQPVGTYTGTYALLVTVKLRGKYFFTKIYRFNHLSINCSYTGMQYSIDYQATYLHGTVYRSYIYSRWDMVLYSDVL